MTTTAWEQWPQASWHDPWACRAVDDPWAGFDEWSDWSEMGGSGYGDWSDWSDGGSTSSSAAHGAADQDANWAVHGTLPKEPLEIRVVRSMGSQACWSLCKEAARADVVAIDLEWMPDWTAGSNNPISVMQLAFPCSQRVYVLQLGHLGRLPAAVQMMLVNPEVTIVGWGMNHSDFAKLSVSEIAIMRTSLIDIQHQCSSLLGTPSSPCSLRSAALTLLQFRLAKDKRVTCSDWARAELTPEQVYYAAMDAWVTLRLFYHLC
eukprot:TRINITY_DN5627_c0_g1_i1.p1 TRINITY_DN5627_c0_g1~~TRINITY_DN5627_c0_g1_i1.p1  ORF type:complete len:278 (+),score=47.81 TRINITY_DN5627_c0_g1_i1:51-836(+)